VCVFIKILFSLLNTMLIVDKHCSDVCCEEFPVTQIDSKANNQKNSDMKNFICNQHGEKVAILNTEDIKICGRITKLEAIKMQFVCTFFCIY